MQAAWSRTASLWDRYSTSGIEHDGSEEARRITLSNQVAIIGLATTVVITAFFILYDALYLSQVIVLNVTVAVMQGAVLALNAQRRRTQAQMLVLAAPCLQFFLLALFLGRDTGAHLPLFVIGMLTFLVVDRDQIHILVYSLVTPALMFMRAHFSFTSDVVQTPLPADVASKFYVLFGLLTFCMIAGFIGLYYLEITRAEKLLQTQIRRSEALLLNILPKPIAEQLKKDHRSIAEAFNDVTVLFADIVDFTRHSESLGPGELVDLLNTVFSRFDKLVDEYGLEKIKTIGDAYMIAGGLPISNENHAIKVATIALRMQQEVERFNVESGHSIQLRIGIHTGPVVAGVIGVKKFSYDIWGDTVNVASRMESHGVSGHIQISKETNEAIQGQFQIEERGPITIKGKGSVRTFFLKGSRAA